MDTNNTRGLTGSEREALIHKIQRLEWLLAESIGLEEYELCSQIRNIIQNLHITLQTNHETG